MSDTPGGRLEPGASPRMPVPDEDIEAAAEILAEHLVKPIVRRVCVVCDEEYPCREVRRAKAARAAVELGAGRRP